MNIRKLAISLAIIGGTALLAGGLLLHSVLAVAGNNDTEMEVSAKKTAPLSGVTAIRIVVKAPADVDITTVPGPEVIAELSGSMYSNADMKEPKLDIETSGNTMTILVEQDRNWRKKVWFNVQLRSELKLTVDIPSNYSGALSVQTVSGDVSSQWSGNTLTVKTVSGDVQAMEFVGKAMDIQTASGDVRIENGKPGRLTARTASGDIALNDLSTGDSRIRTASGDISGTALEGKNLSFKTTSGDVNLSNITGTTLRIASTSGELDVQRLTATTTLAETTSGSIRLRSMTGDLKATSTSGSIKAEIIRFAKQVSCATTSGDIRIRLGTRDHFSLVANTHGDIRYAGPDGKRMEVERRLELPCENCPKSIRLTSVSGDIEVN